MPTCTFFGHRDCPETIKPKLKETLIDLITRHGIDTFYVGNHGHFDAYVRSTLRALKQEYPHIRYAVVLAYLPMSSPTSPTPTAAQLSLPRRRSAKRKELFLWYKQNHLQYNH